MSKRQLVLDAFNNKPTDRVPVGFWFHFAPESEHFKGLEDPSVIQKNLDGHKVFYNAFKPDFLKLMSDGFFGYPNPALYAVKSASALRDVTSIGADHPWILKQIALVKELTDTFGAEVLTFYNIFAPATFFKFFFGNDGNKILADFILEDKEAVKHALNVIAEDLSVLVREIIKTGKADGIYLSAQNIQDPRITPDIYREVITPSEIAVLSAANAESDTNILHICGYEGSRNDLSIYSDYDAKIINWAVNIENVSLSKGKKLFGGKAVIGGFDNTPSGILYSGSREEIEQLTEKLIQEVGKTGVILGADCTVPSDIALSHLEWVRSKAASL